MSEKQTEIKEVVDIAEAPQPQLFSVNTLTGDIVITSLTQEAADAELAHIRKAAAAIIHELAGVVVDNQDFPSTPNRRDPFDSTTPIRAEQLLVHEGYPMRRVEDDKVVPVTYYTFALRVQGYESLRVGFFVPDGTTERVPDRLMMSGIEPGQPTIDKAQEILTIAKSAVSQKE